MELTYLGDRVSAGGGCVTVVIARRRGGWVGGCLGSVVSYVGKRISSIAERCCFLDVCKACNSVWK